MKNQREIMEALLSGKTLISDCGQYERYMSEEGNLLCKDGRVGPIPENPTLWRIKPKTININGYEIPEPLREKGDRDTTYWVPILSMGDEMLSSKCYWSNTPSCEYHLRVGFAHATREAAEAHAIALLSFTINK